MIGHSKSGSHLIQSNMQRILEKERNSKENVVVMYSREELDAPVAIMAIIDFFISRKIQIDHELVITIALQVLGKSNVTDITKLSKSTMDLFYAYALTLDVRY